MKKNLIIAVLVLLIAAPAMAASVVGSKHDMIASGFATMTGGTAEVCIFCHTPHNAVPGEVVGLWNNTAVASVSLAMYTGAPNRSQSSDGDALNFATDQTKINATDARVCLACHDSGVSLPMNMPSVGVIAVGAAMGATTLLGTDMRNDHPIGMDLGANPEVADPSIRSIGAIRGAFGGDPFFGGVENDNVNIMWCSSCHNVHDNANVPFLRKDNTGSALCKACHKK